MKRNACQKCVFAVDDNKPHCGLRGFRNDFNVEYCSAENDTIPNGYELQEDGYFSWVEKKKEYPKTYEECAMLLGLGVLNELKHYNLNILYKKDLIVSLQKLLICRDAYWKIAGDEMGLGKPWEPDWKDANLKYGLKRYGNRIEKVSEMTISFILAFPTEEMRDTFYENFKEEIEICKEFL